MKTPEEFITFILYPKIEGWLLIVKIICLIFAIIFGGFTIWALIFTSWLKRIFLLDFKEFLFYRPIEIQKYQNVWKKIKKRLSSDIEDEIKLAVLEAMELFDEIVSEKRLKGKKLSETLENIKKETEIDEKSVVELEKIKNEIINDPSLKINFEETKKLILNFEKVLKALDVI